MTLVAPARETDSIPGIDYLEPPTRRKVWTVALSLVILSRLMRRRKLVCANFLLADSHLVLDQHDLYTASQVLHLRPVIGAETQARFIEANPFVHEWFPNAKDAPPVAFPLSAARLQIRARDWPDAFVVRLR